MRPRVWLTTLLVVAFSGLFLTACGGEAVAVTAATSTVEALSVPQEIVTVRESAASYLREIAAICAPPDGATWSVDTADPSQTPGATVYRFISADCVLTVAGPEPLPDNPRFYVAYRNDTSAFCWQGLLDAQGEILATGYEQQVPGLDNPAQSYCEAQGHSFEIITKEDGSPCAACVFTDGSSCNAWSYFYDECAPAP